MTRLTFEQYFLFSAVILLILILFDIVVAISLVIKKIIKKRREVNIEIQENKPNLFRPFLDKLTKINFPKPLNSFFTFFWRFKFLILNLILIIISSFIFYKLFESNPRIESSNPADKSTLVSYENPIEVIFDHPVNTKTIETYIAPDIQGEWRIERINKYLPFARKIQFYPQESMPPETPVRVYFSCVSKIIGRQECGEHEVQFTTAKLPSIVSVSTDTKNIDFGISEPIDISLDLPNGNFVEWGFVFTPEIPADSFSIEDLNETTIRLTFNQKLSQSTDYTLDIYRTPTKYNLSTKEISYRGEKSLVKTSKFKTVDAPMIDSFSPTGGNIYTDEKVKAVFKQEMNTSSVESLFQITPETQGTFSWEDSKTFIFSPQTLSKNTEYTVTFGAGTDSKAGGVLETPVSFTFSTIGYVKVSYLSPYNGQNSVSISTQINIVFDQPVDQNSAQEHFSINPNVGGSFSWSGNTMYYNLNSNLSYQTSYYINISKGIKTIYGLDSISDFNSTFTTESQVFSLNLPQIYQTHTFTCNITAARMALAYRGVNISDEQVVSFFGYDPTPHDTVNNIWGNPYSQYVGTFESGYGVYWDPIASAIRNYRPADTHTGWNLTDMLKEVHNGNPVVIWGQNGWSQPNNISWHTPGGQYIYAIQGMHSEVVKGFIGTPEDPSYILLNDPWRGNRQYTVSHFMYLWGFFNYSAVVVY